MYSTPLFTNETSLGLETNKEETNLNKNLVVYFFINIKIAKFGISTCNYFTEHHKPLIIVLIFNIIKLTFLSWKKKIDSWQRILIIILVFCFRFLRQGFILWTRLALNFSLLSARAIVKYYQTLQNVSLSASHRPASENSYTGTKGQNCLELHL